MKGLKAKLLKVGVPVLAFAGSASATDINVTESLAPVLAIVDWLPGLLNSLIPVMIAIAVIVTIGGLIALVLGIFKKIPQMLHFKI